MNKRSGRLLGLGLFCHFIKNKNGSTYSQIVSISPPPLTASSGFFYYFPYFEADRNFHFFAHFCRTEEIRSMFPSWTQLCSPYIAPIAIPPDRSFAANKRKDEKKIKSGFWFCNSISTVVWQCITL